MESRVQQMPLPVAHVSRRAPNVMAIREQSRNRNAERGRELHQGAAFRVMLPLFQPGEIDATYSSPIGQRLLGPAERCSMTSNPATEVTMWLAVHCSK